MQLTPGGDVMIYFVQDASSSDKCMRKAFLTCQDARLQPKIISEEELGDVPRTKSTVFVLEQFKGLIFKSLSATDSLVVGPRCIDYCIANKTQIPANESPVFTLAMKDVIVTATNLPRNKKEELASLICYMGGSYTDQLTGAVTHLISDDGRSPKYKKAVEHQIPIMRSEWVAAIWEASQIKDVSAFNSEFLKYKLPAFTGMHISCSNLTQGVKKKIQSVVEAHGGVYMTALEQNKTTALIIGEADGKKYQAAQLWGIPCLNTDWVFQSAEREVALPTKDYLITARPRCSTPTNELPSFMSNDVSCIPFGAESANNTVDETNTTVSSMNSFRSNPVLPVRPQTQKPQIHEFKKIMEKINLAEAAAAGLFLDGCKVFLSGFHNQELDKMKKLINKSGATLFPEISDRLSHVIMGDFIQDHVKEIDKLAEKPHVVGVEWILASVRLKTAAPAEPYICFKTKTNNKGPVPPASPLSHKGLSLLKSNTSKADSPKSGAPEGMSTSRKLFVKAHVQKNPISSQEDDDSSERLRGPAVRSDMSRITGDQPLLQQPPSLSPEPQKPPAPEPQEMHSNANSTCETSSMDIQPFLKDLVFLVIGFDDPTTIIESIFAVGGKVESAHFQGVADYAVVPLNGVTTQLTATEVVTPLWVEDCYEQNKVVAVEYFHQPVSLKSDVTPLKGCVICVSGYLGKERIFIVHLAGALGALVQDSFSRKDHPAKNIYKSTHLVCKTPSGPKYTAAMKWAIPVTNESWLLASVSSGSLAPIEAHQFGDRGEIPITPKIPAIQRVKASDPDFSNAVIDQTPNRTTPNQKQVDETKECTSNNQKLANKSMESPASTSRISSPAGGELTIPMDCEQTRINQNDASTKENITPRNSLHNNTTVDCFTTPGNALRRVSNIGSAGKSPFHTDTPTSPYGRVFLGEGSKPSPDTRKKWKRFIDNLPDLYEKSPEVQEFKKRRPSTPLNVIMKQIWVKFGGAEIDGIDPDTGDLLPQGPYSEWAHENTSISCNENDKPMMSAENARKDNSIVNPESVSKELSHLKSRLNSVLTSSQQKAPDIDVGTPDSNNQGGTDTCSMRAGNWITPKGIDKQTAQTEMQWDFGKPTISVAKQSCNVAKKLRLSNDEEDKTISEQVSKLYDNDKKQGPKQEKKIFVLSQMNASSKDKFEGIIKSLGGEVSTSPCFEPRSTHLVVDKILRSEKLLCAVASGKWVLHSSYLTQCYQSRMFLPEDDYEWGSERSRDRLPSIVPGTTEWNLARAVHTWRVRRTDMGQPDAFRNFKAVILTTENKLAQYMRLLQAGNATLLPVARILEATHVFWDEDKVPLPTDRNILKSHKIPLLKPVYLGDYLAKNPPPSLEDYTIR